MPRGTPRSKEAKHHPVMSTGGISTDEAEIPQQKPRSVHVTADGVALSPQGVIVTEPIIDMEKMAMLAFMSEEITIRIGTTTDKNAEKIFEININGKNFLFRRGGTYTVPRYVVDRMLRLKPTVYTQEEVINSEGVKEFIHPGHSALKYDFTVERDGNPRGSEWHRAVMNEPS